ncbi:MAG: hypothetical protein JWM99_2083 [Verrucomicrobiales bacterium]|nr:hypothetical protein [Verrucomicrobiales bacterium]
MQVSPLSRALLIVSLFATVAVSAQQNSIDSSFRASVDGSIATLAAQPDGKLIIGGSFQAVNDQSVVNLSRLNADGSVDSSFVLDGAISSAVQSVLLAPGGKIICQGSTVTSGGQTISPLFRLNNNGSIDQTFSPFAGCRARKIAVQTDGKVVIGYRNAPYVARLNVDGSMDSTFQAALTESPAMEAGVDSLAIQVDGKILVGGTFNTQMGSQNLVRLNSDGSLDESYSGAPGPLLYVYNIFIQNDGKAIASGKTAPYYGSLPLFRRLNSDRTLDTSFADGSQKVAVAAQSGDTFYTKGQEMLRLDLDGIVDDSFSAALAGGTISSVAIQADQKVVAAGNFSTVNGEVHNNIVRFNATAQAATNAVQVLAFTQPCNSAENFCTTLSGAAGVSYVIEASSDFSHWTEIATETANESGLAISFPRSALPSPCFFRAKLASN